MLMHSSAIHIIRRIRHPAVTVTRQSMTWLSRGRLTGFLPRLHLLPVKPSSPHRGWFFCKPLDLCAAANQIPVTETKLTLQVGGLSMTSEPERASMAKWEVKYCLVMGRQEDQE